MEVTKRIESFDFDQEVLQASRLQPILVDFWAPWCGPCQILGPVLERLAAEAQGQWALVKVNTDLHPTLSARYHVRGIPAVKLFVDGQAIAEFTGALPEPILRKWLDEHVPSPTKTKLAEARTLLGQGDRAAAAALLADVLDATPAHEDARLLMARARVFEAPADARALVEGLYTPVAEALREMAYRLEQDPTHLADAPVQADFAHALRALQATDLETALDGFIGVLTRDRKYEDDGARKATVALFTVLGEAHPVVKKYRPVFNRSLY